MKEKIIEILGTLDPPELIEIRTEQLMNLFNEELNKRPSMTLDQYSRIIDDLEEEISFLKDQNKDQRKEIREMLNNIER